MKFKIPCPTSLLSVALVICGAILSDNLQAMSPAASAARQNVFKNLQLRITGEESFYEADAQKFFQGLGLTPAIVAASGVTLPATVSSTPIVGATKPLQGFSLMDLAIQNTIRAGTPTGDSGSAMLFDLLYFGAPAYSFANKNQPGAYGTRLSKSMGLPFVLPSAGAHVGTLYHAIKAGNISSACAVVATDPNLQIAGNDVNSFWLGASCTSTSGCCGNNVCKNGVCDTGSVPVTTCPTVPCPSGYNCVSGACVLIPVTTCPTVPCQSGYSCVSGTCVKNVPVACTASSCGVGNYCNVATGSCVAGCLSAANCGGTTALCDTTLNTCVAQIQGTDSGCYKAADCALGACNSGTCAKPAGPITCLTDANCGAGNYCDLTAGICVTGATIPKNHGCTNLGVATGGCAAGLACQPVGSGTANTCQALTCSAPNALDCTASGNSATLNGCLDGTNCCSCACSTNYTCQG